MSVSRPATPPSKAPASRDEWRFKTLTTPCEWVEKYHPGGYHPVHIDDTFHDGQYRVVRKLGEGSFSTVWLARDLLNQKYVALKIVVASASQTNEVRLSRFLMQKSSHASRYITRLLETFEHTGPNGVHKCLVFEPMGPNVNFMLEDLPQFNPRTIDMNVRYPPEMGRSILKQSLQALAFLHENGIAHGDFQPGNMLFSIENIDSVPEDQLRQTKEMAQENRVTCRSISPPVERLDGKTDLWAPRYLCAAQPLSAFAKHMAGFKIKLSDLGGAYFFNEPPSKLLTPQGLRAPETILANTLNKALDVWSFGCLVFEIMTGQRLFNLYSFESEVDTQDEHLLELNACLGSLSKDFTVQWNRFSLYFTPDGTLYNCRIGGGKGAPYMSKQKSLENRFDDAAPDLDEKEATAVKALIRRILQCDPAKRPTPSELLQDPWFRDIDDAGNLTS